MDKWQSGFSHIIVVHTMAVFSCGKTLFSTKLVESAPLLIESQVNVLKKIRGRIVWPPVEHKISVDSYA